jgi:hypothetical protein
MTTLMKRDEDDFTDINILNAELYGQVFKKISLPIILFKPNSENEFEIVEFNSAFTESFSCPEFDLTGKLLICLEPLISERGVNALTENILKCKNSMAETVFSITLYVKRKRYHSRFILWPLINESNETTHILAVHELLNSIKTAESKITELKINNEKFFKDKVETLILTNKHLREKIKENNDLKQQFFFMSKNFMSLIKSYPGFLYAVDSLTYEILVMKEELISKTLSANSEKRCFKRLYGFNNPCSFCLNKNVDGLNIDKSKIRVEIINNPENIVTQSLKWINGREILLRRELSTNNETKIKL